MRIIHLLHLLKFNILINTFISLIVLCSNPFATHIFGVYPFFLYSVLKNLENYEVLQVATF